MSKHVAKCGRCSKHWNMKHRGDTCPRCGWHRLSFTSPPSPESLKELQEHFNG